MTGWALDLDQHSRDSAYLDFAPGHAWRATRRPDFGSCTPSKEAMLVLEEEQPSCFLDFGEILHRIEVGEGWREQIGYRACAAMRAVETRKSKCAAQFENLRLLARAMSSALLSAASAAHSAVITTHRDNSRGTISARVETSSLSPAPYSGVSWLPAAAWVCC